MGKKEFSIEEKIKEIAAYCENKIISGDFEFVSCDEYTARVVVDRQYAFLLWVVNDPKDFFGFRFYNQDSTLVKDIGEFTFKTEKSRLAGWRAVKPFVENYKNNILVREKEEQIKKLESNLTKLKGKKNEKI